MDDMPRGRVLLIAHELPPSAGGGVQRLSAFVRFLGAEGWDVTAIAAEPLPARPRDESLLSATLGISIHRLPARDVATAIARVLAPLKRLRAAVRRSGVPPIAGQSSSPTPPSDTPEGQDSSRVRSPLSARLSRWVAMPDDAIFWSRRIPPLAARLHAEQSFDVVLASGPPFSALLAGVRVGRALGVPVVLDLRDAWAHSYHARWPTARKQRRFVELERQAMTGADAVVTVSDPIAAEVTEMGARRVMVLPNGFDSAEMPAWTPVGSTPLSLVFVGRLSPGAADPAALFASIARAVALDPSAMEGFHLDVIGPDAPWAREMAARLGVGDLVTFHPFKPYREVLAEVAHADRGVIILANTPASSGVYSGKLFDYLGVGVPLLVFGPEESGAAIVARETGCGRVVVGDDVDLGARTLIDLAAAKKRGEQGAPCDPKVRAKFDRREQVARLSALLREVVQG